MKKALSLILVLVLSLSLCACGSTASVEETIDENTYKTPIIDENNYKTPLNAYMEYMSTPFPAYEKIPAVYNGWAQREVKVFYAVTQEILNEIGWDESMGGHRFWLSPDVSYENEFGKDAKMSYEIKEISELSQEQLEEYQKGIASFVKWRRDNWNKEDYVAMMVDDLQFSEKHAKELLDACQAYIDKMEDAVVEEGYHIKMTVTISSSTLEKDQQQNWSTCIYKIDGRWVMAFWDSTFYRDPVNETMHKLGLF